MREKDAHNWFERGNFQGRPGASDQTDGYPGLGPSWRRSRGEEVLIDALVRETKEEPELDVQTVRLTGLYSRPKWRGAVILLAFLSFNTFSAIFSRMSGSRFIDELPDYLFWDVDRRKVDADKHARYLICRIMDRGRRKDAYAAWEYYGPERVKAALVSAPALDRKTIAGGKRKWGSIFWH